MKQHIKPCNCKTCLTKKTTNVLIPEEQNILTMFQSVKKKEQLPRLYSIVLQNRNHLFLYQDIEYSLEDAIELARIAAREQNPLVPPNWGYVMSVHSTIGQLKDKIINCNIKIVNKKEQDKNTLMKKIIETKDEVLFEQNKNKFNENECALLLEKINKKSNTSH